MQKEANAGKRRKRKAFVAFLTLYTSQKAVANEVTIKNQIENSFWNHVHLRKGLSSQIITNKMQYATCSQGYMTN